ncbi:Predicted arabinose efflux permease, MFS family [Paenibacillus sp. UNCCL117]|uniref:MFS transporter n=1 Tax=unclassified Paenibacillus TaxID=185978 RepID=UPI0008912696|nr:MULTISPECIES: MFS transporter [unclassified Paenibacillus]SDE37529.1 Predicted arabinose efflux permease, MFS family [Paenibacillus sp. cl123]SFW64958.1 Predicted arabinose efflux permease, MFS family [Paenibacillus sp. UNCCL117]
MNPSVSPEPRLWTRSFILLTLSNLLLYLNLQMITPALPSYVTEAFGADQFAVGLVISLFALTAVVARLFTGRMLKTGPRLAILLVGLAFYVLATISFYAAGSFLLFLAIRLLYGVGFGVASTTYGTMVSDIIPMKRIGEGMGYFGLSSGFSMALAPLIGLWLLDAYGFGTLIAVAAVLGALIIPLVYGVRAKRPQQETAPAAAESAPKSMSPEPPPASPAQAESSGNRRLNRGMLLPFLLSMMLAFTYGGLISFLALYGKEANLANVGWFFLFNAGAVVLVRPFAGKLFDTRGHLAVLPPAALLVLVGLLCLSYTHGLAGLIVSALCYGTGYGMLQPSLQAWMVGSVSPERRGSANAAFYNSIDLGIALGSLLLGSIAASTGYAWMYRMSALTMVLFLLLYGGTLLMEARFRKVAASGLSR